MLRLLPTAALAFALLAPAAHADVVATTAKPTPLAAADGKVLYSAWDGSQYRLTQLGAGALNVAGSDAPFVARHRPRGRAHRRRLRPRRRPVPVRLRDQEGAPAGGRDRRLGQR